MEEIEAWNIHREQKSRVELLIPQMQSKIIKEKIKWREENKTEKSTNTFPLAIGSTYTKHNILEI